MVDDEQVLFHHTALDVLDVVDNETNDEMVEFSVEMLVDLVVVDEVMALFEELHKEHQINDLIYLDVVELEYALVYEVKWNASLEVEIEEYDYLELSVVVYIDIVTDEVELDKMQLVMVEVDEEMLEVDDINDINEYSLLDMLVELLILLEVTVKYYVTDIVFIALLLTEL